MKYSLGTILSVILLLCLVSGCIKEDRSECNPGVLLKYDYSLNPERRNLFGDEVGKVTVYVFDENGLYYDSFSDEGSHLTNDWQMLLPIPPGNYTIVVWGGLLEHYRVGELSKNDAVFQNKLEKGVTHIDDFMLTAEQGEQPLMNLDNLYHGISEVTSVFWPKTFTIVDLMKNTKHLTVKVQDSSVGKDSQDGDDAPYEVYCTGANARYFADNSFGRKAETVTYCPYDYIVKSGEIITELDLLRLVEGNPVRLVVKNKEGKIIYDKDLVEQLRATGQYGSQEDLDRESEYEVVIRVDKDVVISVSINGWVAVEIKPEL